MPTDQALSLCPQTKLNDELNHDKDSYSVPTGFWDQSYWGERSDESIKIIQKVNDELDHDKDSYSVPTGFWDQGYWGERSAESIKIIQKVNGELNHDKDTYAVPTGFWDQGYWGERSAESIKKNKHVSAPARCRHGSRGRKVREPPLHAPFAPHRQPFATTRLCHPSYSPTRIRAVMSQAAPPIAGPPGLRSTQQVWHVPSPEGLLEHHQEIDCGGGHQAGGQNRGQEGGQAGGSGAGRGHAEDQREEEEEGEGNHQGGGDQGRAGNASGGCSSGQGDQGGCGGANLALPHK